MSHLLEDSSGDPSYVEDFLLTHRIFIESPLIVCSQLLEWYAHANTLCVLSPPNVHSLIQVFTFFFYSFLSRDSFNDPTVRDKVTRVVLLWVNNHFTDFETDPCMMEFLETFECLLEQSKMQSHVNN